MTDHSDDDAELTNAAPGFTAAWWSLITDHRLPDGAVRLYLVIASHTRGHRNVAFPGQKRLCELTQQSRATLARNLAALIETGWLVVRRKNRNEVNRYYLQMPPSRCLTDETSDVSPVRHPCRSITNEVNPPTPRSGGRRRGELTAAERADDFAAWYARYPRHIGKLDAVKAWRQVLNQLPPLAELLDATDALRAWQTREHSTDNTYTPYPATWLRAGRWMDEQDPQPGGVPVVVRPCIMCAAPNPREECNGPNYCGPDFDMGECPWRT